MILQTDANCDNVVSSRERPSAPVPLPCRTPLSPRCPVYIQALHFFSLRLQFSVNVPISFNTHASLLLLLFV